MTRLRVSLEPALILHQRSYRETSRLIEAFTPGHGRVGLVARGVRAPRGGRAALLQPLQPLLLSWNESGELGTLAGVEAAGPAYALAGEPLICAWYLNELLLRVLPRQDAHARLYAYYVAALSELAGGARPVQPVLREFELNMLEELGYGLTALGEVDPALRYHYHEHGLFAAADGIWSGAELAAVAHRDWSPQALRAARRLARQQLAPLLGSRPLATPQLLQSLRRLQGGDNRSEED